MFVLWRLESKPACLYFTFPTCVDAMHQNENEQSTEANQPRSVQAMQALLSIKLEFVMANKT